MGQSSWPVNSPDSVGDLVACDFLVIHRYPTVLGHLAGISRNRSNATIVCITYVSC
jgi:hypothetical protein